MTGENRTRELAGVSLLTSVELQRGNENGLLTNSGRSKGITFIPSFPLSFSRTENSRARRKKKAIHISLVSIMM
ncbi:MAG: hypothetical protein ACFFD4_23935 [Candidatus Odinarchaeota archaeon]